MQVEVTTLDDENFTLFLDASDDVEALMSKIEERKGIHRFYQKLLYNGEELRTGRTLESYCIDNGSKLKVLLMLRLRGGAGPSKTFFVTTGRSDDPRFVTVELTDTVKELKRKVEEKFGIPASQRPLHFDNMRLVDSWSLDAYKITDGSRIDLF